MLYTQRRRAPKLIQIIDVLTVGINRSSDLRSLSVTQFIVLAVGRLHHATTVTKATSFGSHRMVSTEPASSNAKKTIISYFTSTYSPELL